MKANSCNFPSIFGWISGSMVLLIGIANLVLVHPVPGIVFTLLSLVFFPPITSFVRTKTSWRAPLLVKLALVLVIIWFTLGVSDLGDLIDKL